MVSTPHVGRPGQNTHPDIDRSTLGLKEVRSTLWFDVVWTNLLGDAAPPNFPLANSKRHWADFDRPMYHAGQNNQIELTVKTNWKLAVENYRESYHLPSVHPSLSSYSPLEDHYKIEHPWFCSGHCRRVYQQMRDQHDRCFPNFEGLSDKSQTAAEYIAVCPNVLLGVQDDHTFAIIIAPGGHENTEHIHLYYATSKPDTALRRRNRDQ